VAELTVAVLTPEASLFSGVATGLVARSAAGFYTVLAGHMDSVTNLVPGALRVDLDSGEETYAVHGGFVQVSHDETGTTATVLAPVAERVTEIDVARATAAKESATNALSGVSEDDDNPDVLSARARLARADLRLELASAR
jgi:F-type H+-transporting ATPase subunit epsilon